MDWMNVARFPDGDVGPYFFSLQPQGCIWGQGSKTTSLDNAQVFVTWEYLFLYRHLRKEILQDRQWTITWALRRVRVTIVAVETQLSVKYCVCVCVCVCVACLAVSHFDPSHKRYDFQKKKLLNIKRLFWFSVQILFDNFLILRMTEIS